MFYKILKSFNSGDFYLRYVVEYKFGERNIHWQNTDNNKNYAFTTNNIFLQ